ncbi:MULTISPECIES: polysaccharide pyruvyl transferase family protein [Aeromonas]|uniref:polysaccharide pyruvyl transferase family protein n=1 Tax=Aeromonas TaxID=642 RepID=UPI00058A559D|nr:MULTISPECIES: polysaccharide pyruvyl transferase family protein [Aeromonas]QXB29556.1 polysaccharide pyruvyl transferase family protein [Aeromonas sp. FDAARGOS 1405]
MNKVKIGFLWHNVSSGNLGVGALSIGNMILVDRVCQNLGIDADFFTIGDNEVTSEQNKALVERQIGRKFEHITISVKELISNPIKLKSYIKMIKDFDLVLDIGAGDSFSDIYGNRRFLIQVFTKLVNAIFARKSVLSPQTIGPFKSRFAEIVSRFIIRNTSLVFARDDISFKVGKEFGSCNLGTDVALSMPYSTVREVSDKIKVGINVSGLLWNGGYTRDNQFGLAHNYKDYINELIESFLSVENIEIHLVSHVIATSPVQKIEDDYAACIEVAELFPRCIVAPRFTNPIEVKNYISSFEYFTGARMHATIAAFSSGVPVTPYAYSRKFKGLYTTLGYDKVLEAKELSLKNAIKMNVDHFNKRIQIKLELQGLTDKKNQLTEKYTSALEGVLK